MKKHPDISGLKEGLDSLYKNYSGKWIDTDPVCIPHKFSSSEDIETAGLISAVFAYGKVRLFLPKITEVIGYLKPSPHKALSDLSKNDINLLDGFYYRFQTENDARKLLIAISTIIKRHGCIKNLFLQGYNSNDENIIPALNKFVISIRKIILEDGGEISHGLSHLFPLPGNGAMKRLNMFLRWMVRKDNVDFGIWSEINPSQLIIPVDTHINRISFYLKLSNRKIADIKNAVEITNSLKKFSMDDPVKYDFALTRLGMYYCNLQNPNRCVECLLKDYCINSR